MPPDSLTWPLGSHTKGKHSVLRSYLGAWLPIMTRWNRRVLFIDAFAGPGEYAGGEAGSPVIALDAFLEHAFQKHITNDIIYVFIEKEKERYEHLKTLLQPYVNKLPDNCKVRVFNSTFDERLTEVLDRIDAQNTQLDPAFVMIDPFGWSDTPMETIRRILRNDKAEVYISFMASYINRFKDNPEQKDHFDTLFGCSNWQQGTHIENSSERYQFFFNLYKSQLKRNGAKYVLHFELYEGNQLVYAIFFGTKNLKGCDEMKKAIWKIAPFGDCKFYGSQIDQPVLGPSVADFTPLEKGLHNKFDGRGWTRIEDVVDFVMSDETDFHSGQLKIKVLKPMEARNEIEVKLGTRKRAGTFPDRTELRFLDSRNAQ